MWIIGRFMDWIADGLDAISRAIEPTWDLIMEHFTYIAWGMIVVITVATLLAQPNPAAIVFWVGFTAFILISLRVIGGLRYDE